MKNFAKLQEAVRNAEAKLDSVVGDEEAENTAFDAIFAAEIALISGLKSLVENDPKYKTHKELLAPMWDNKVASDGIVAVAMKI